MTPNPTRKAILYLEDGTVLEGQAIGWEGTTSGEICFNTGMTGYQEIFTDPSYFQQILVMTNVHIGNYGVRNLESESDKVQISGLVIRNFSQNFSRNRADMDLDSFLKQHQIVGIAGIDTRLLVRDIRTKGAMNALISTDGTTVEELGRMMSGIPSMEGLELSSQVTTDEVYYLGDPEADYRVSVLDYGVKKNILRNLVKRNCYLKVFPARTPAAQVLEWKPDGVFLSNGPGDPAAMPYAVDTAQDVIATGLPVFGICLGHQILALACGMRTFKMHHGHRGINHPVINLESGLSEITSQNHGFAVDLESVRESREEVKLTHINLNDQTLEGFSLIHKPVFCVQYHPEAAPGPHDSAYLFDRFVQNMAKAKGQEVKLGSHSHSHA